MKKALPFYLFVLAALALLVPLAKAAVFSVNDTVADGDPGSLRDAVKKANATIDKDTIDLQPGKYLLDIGQLVIQRDLSIKGSSVDNTVIDGGENDRVFFITTAIDPNICVTVEKVTITGGKVKSQDSQTHKTIGGGGIFNEGDLTIKHSLISDNTVDSTGDTPGYGGAIRNRGKKARLTLIESELKNNKIKSNWEAFGGGISSEGDNAVLTLVDSHVTTNLAAGKLEGAKGGGIYNQGDLSISNSTVSDNSTEGETAVGGGVWSAGELTVNDSEISRNLADGSSVASGGGLKSFGTNVLLRSRVAENTASALEAFGGGLQSSGENATLTLIRSWAIGNQAGTGSAANTDTAFGAGILVDGDNAKVTLIHCQIRQNKLWAQAASGAGINLSGRNSELTIEHGIIAQNQAEGNSVAEGGGIWMDSTSSYFPQSVTIEDNLPDQIFPSSQP